MSEAFWVVEMMGPAYLGVRHSGGYEFAWTRDIQGRDGVLVLRFHSRPEADMAMMAIRQLRGDLFPVCLPECARAVEHSYMENR